MSMPSTTPPALEASAAQVAAAFQTIHDQSMAGLPLLNLALSVAALHFQTFAGRVFGVILTPWMMNLIVLPGDDTEAQAWSTARLGTPWELAFPAGPVRFLSNHIEGIGPCQMHSAYSPMREFSSQAEALFTAQAYLQRLFTAPNPEKPHEPTVDERLLGRILRGEKVPEAEALADVVLAETATETVVVEASATSG